MHRTPAGNFVTLEEGKGDLEEYGHVCIYADLGFFFLVWFLNSSRLTLQIKKGSFYVLFKVFTVADLAFQNTMKNKKWLDSKYETFTYIG